MSPTPLSSVTGMRYIGSNTSPQAAQTCPFARRCVSPSKDLMVSADAFSFKMKTRWTLTPNHPEVVYKLINTIYPSSQLFHAKQSWFVLSLLRQKPFDSLDCLLHFSLPFISDSSFFSARLIRITAVEHFKPDANERGRKDIKWEVPRNIFLSVLLTWHRKREDHCSRTPYPQAQRRPYPWGELCFKTLNTKCALKSFAYNIKAMKLHHTAPPVLAFVD